MHLREISKEGKQGYSQSTIFMGLPKFIELQEVARKAPILSLKIGAL